MQGITESCSICSRTFEVQFRYQMEERDGGFVFFCSQACQSKQARGETGEGVTCDACGKRFVVELVSQMVKAKGGRKYACSDACRTQVLAEVNGVRLGSLAAPVARASGSGRDARAGVGARQLSSVPRRLDRPPAAAHRRPEALAIFNHKGGTGKTTTSVSVAAGLAARARASFSSTPTRRATSACRWASRRSGRSTTCSSWASAPRTRSSRCARTSISSSPTRPSPPPSCTSPGARTAIASCATAWRRPSTTYDVVVLDCSPSLSLMNQNALVAADSVLVPVACDFLSLVGVRQVIKTVKNVNTILHHPVQIYGVLPTFYDARARICRDAVETMKEHFGDGASPPSGRPSRSRRRRRRGRPSSSTRPTRTPRETTSASSTVSSSGPRRSRPRTSARTTRGWQSPEAAREAKENVRSTFGG